MKVIFKVESNVEIKGVYEVKPTSKNISQGYIILSKKDTEKLAVVGLFKGKLKEKEGTYLVEQVLNGLEIFNSGSSGKILLKKKYIGYKAIIGVYDEKKVDIL